MDVNGEVKLFFWGGGRRVCGGGGVRVDVNGTEK